MARSVIPLDLQNAPFLHARSAVRFSFANACGCTRRGSSGSYLSWWRARRKGFSDEVRELKRINFRRWQSIDLLSPSTIRLQHGAGSLFHPGPPQIRQGLAIQDSFGERKDNAFFFVEMFARGSHGGEQQLTGLSGLFRFLNQLKIVLNLLVFHVKCFAMPNLFETMLQRSDKQFILSSRMGIEHRFH